jgi:hypothetical protein
MTAVLLTLLALTLICETVWHHSRVPARKEP